jgi:hypothetical protein
VTGLGRPESVIAIGDGRGQMAGLWRRCHRKYSKSSSVQTPRAPAIWVRRRADVADGGVQLVLLAKVIEILENYPGKR